MRGGRENDSDTERGIQTERKVVQLQCYFPDDLSPPCDLLPLWVTSDPIHSVIHLPLVYVYVCVCVKAGGGACICAYALYFQIIRQLLLQHGDPLRVFMCVFVCACVLIHSE